MEQKEIIKVLTKLRDDFIYQKKIIEAIAIPRWAVEQRKQLDNMITALYEAIKAVTLYDDVKKQRDYYKEAWEDSQPGPWH